VTDSTVLISVT